MSSELQSSYDRLAKTYADRLYGELANKPFDRLMLNWLIEKVGGRGVICDLGCGPGQIARYLRDHGVKVCGIDLSAAMVAQAQMLNPDIAFEQGDMRALSNIQDNNFGGIAAFYSIIHVLHDEIGLTLKELWRVLQPGGVLLLTFHIGRDVRHIDTLWSIPVALDFQFYECETMKDALENAGFLLEEAIERDPYPDPVEVQTRRAYVFARKPAE